MVSVGLWGAFLGRPLIIALPVIFPTVMAGGAVLGMAHTPMPPVEIGIALSVLVLGAMIAFAVKAPIWVACLIVGVFAMFHGYAHGAELPSAADPIGYAVGFVLATGLLHVAGIGIGLLNHWRGGVFLTRGMGALVALAGVGFLYATWSIERRRAAAGAALRRFGVGARFRHLPRPPRRVAGPDAGGDRDIVRPPRSGVEGSGVRWLLGRRHSRRGVGASSARIRFLGGGDPRPERRCVGRER